MSNPVSRLILKRNYKGPKCMIQLLVHKAGPKGECMHFIEMPRARAKELGVQNGLYLNYDKHGNHLSVTKELK